MLEALDGRCLLRDQLVEEIARRVGPEPQQRLRSGFAFFLDEVCQGPPQGNRVTFVRPDQWIGAWQAVDEREALREVCRRYLHTYGPARPIDFREWFSARGLSTDQARALFEALGDELEEVDVDGHGAYVLAGDTAFPKPESNVRLLSEYDVFVMGFRERDRLIPESVRQQVRRHSKGRYEGPAGVRLVVVDGIAAGLWERRRRGKRVQVSIDIALARKLTRAQRAALDHELERIGATLGLDPTLSIE